jgi:hypothetical protein
VVRVAVARRVPGREIHYTGIDGARLQLESIISLVAPSKVASAKSQLSRGAVGGTEGEVGSIQRRMRERYIRTEIDLHDPVTLTSQLEDLLGSERFDEIHVHLLHPRTDSCHPRGPLILRTIAAYLRPGARLYHLFQHSSPLFDFKPERNQAARQQTCPDPGTAADAIGRDEARFREGASKGGLLLDKCGRRWELRMRRGVGEAPGRWYRVWLTRRFSGTEPHRHTAEVYERLAKEYSAFSSFATHFVILRKSRRRTRHGRKQTV